MQLTKNQKEIINERLDICDEMAFVAMDDLWKGLDAASSPLG